MPGTIVRVSLAAALALSASCRPIVRLAVAPEVPDTRLVVNGEEAGAIELPVGWDTSVVLLESVRPRSTAFGILAPWVGKLGLRRFNHVLSRDACAWQLRQYDGVVSIVPAAPAARGSRIQLGLPRGTSCRVAGRRIDGPGDLVTTERRSVELTLLDEVDGRDYEAIAVVQLEGLTRGELVQVFLHRFESKTKFDDPGLFVGASFTTGTPGVAELRRVQPSHEMAAGRLRVGGHVEMSSRWHVVVWCPDSARRKPSDLRLPDELRR